MTALLVIIIVLIVSQITFSLLDSKKMDRIESKLDAIEAKTPYKKRVRKVKDNSKTDKEANEENN